MQITPPGPRLCFQLALLAAACIPIHPLRAQDPNSQQNPQPEPVYTTARLDAVVVSSLDGKPVARVLVTSPDHRMAAITDSEGRFSFDLRRVASQTSRQVFSTYPPSPASAAATIPIQFNVRKPGYIADTVILHLPAAQPDTPEPALQLKIVPAAVLTGHLDPESGDLPPFTTVQLKRKNVNNGTANWGINSAQVNSRGEFRFANLAPGDFKLLVPAYVPQNLKGTSPDSIPGFRSTFYPNASSFDSAGVIHLGPGETASANLVYHNATFYNVTIPVTGLAEGTGFYAALLPDVAGLSLSHSGNVSQGYLPSGSYNVMLTSAEVSTPKGDYPSSFIASVHLQIDAKPVRIELVAFHPALEVPVEVRPEFSNITPPQNDQQHPGPLAWVGLQSVVSVALNPITRNLPSGGIVIQNLSEGLFHVDATSAMGGYVASVTSGDTDLLREPLRVLPGVAPRPIEVILRDDSATINARLAPAADLLPQASDDQQVYILCIALDRPQAMAINFAVQRDDFPMPNLAPGRYLILASHRQIAQSIEYRDESVVRDLLGKGTVVTVSSGQKVDVEVPLMPGEEGK